jgi:hypothetical protein
MLTIKLKPGYLMMIKHLLKTALLVTAAGFTLSTPVMAQGALPKGVFGNEKGTGKLMCIPIPVNAPEAWVRSVIWDTQTLRNGGPCDPDLEYVDSGTWGRTILLSGEDTSGRRADFRFYVLNERYAWALGSAQRIEDRGLAANFNTLMGTSEFKERLCTADAVLGVGAASYEGETATNHKLAGARSKVIAQQAKAVADTCSAGGPTAYTVNLGEHVENESSNTADQRKVVVILVRNSEEGVNVTEALKNAVGDAELVGGFKLTDYDLLNLAAY